MSSPPNPSSPRAEAAAASPIHQPIAPEIDNDRDSSYDSDIASSTASVSASILQYRTLHGRTFHSDKTSAEYWGPNDERQNECMDIIHHLLTLVLGDKLFRAPLDEKKLHKVLDVGTGTGTWAIDFADAYPGIEVIGTDISPIQPTWVPPNLFFEIEDATQRWTFDRDTFDYVHMRYLFGSIADWTELYRQAYRVLKPGAWVESFEADALLTSEDDTILPGSALDQWGKVFIEAGKKTGRTFLTVNEDVQRKGLEAAGFTNIVTWDFNCPMTGWPADPKLREMGHLSHIAFEQDLEGMILYMAKEILNWSLPQIHVYLAQFRKEMRDKNVHPIFKLRCVYAQKPEDAAAS